MTNKTDKRPILARLRVWFEDYISRFVSDDSIFQENIDLKVGHTYRVCEAILDIGESLNLDREELCLAETSALLHDIGRFEQYRQYRTFSDYRSEDHAALGIKVIKTSSVLNGFEPAEAEIIIRVIGYHNRAALPVGEDERCLFFLKLLRDADKIDIWHVVTDYYQSAGYKRNQTIELDLPDMDQISDSVYEALMKGELAQMADLKTLNDFKSLQIGWIYDVNFPRTFQIIMEKRYLEKIREALPKKSVRADEIYNKANAYLERNISSLFIT
ncbi:MAG: HD domain-containing protein [Deltaproteobacteria bacterium]|nr:HD domain-containing protein [Deltaproteobacteria bacterium]